MADTKARTHVTSGERPTVYERWEPPELQQAGSHVETPAEPPRSTTFVPSVSGEVHCTAYQGSLAEGREEGQRLGRQEGLAAGKAEVLAEADRFRELMRTLSRPLEQLDENVERSLVMLSMTVARQLVRKELKSEPGQVVAAVREAVTTLPVAARAIQVHLHPDDAELVRVALNLNSNAAGPWEIVEDPVLTRGGCRVVTEDSHIDATVESRLAATIAEVLGGERQDDAGA